VFETAARALPKPISLADALALLLLMAEQDPAPLHVGMDPTTTCSRSSRTWATCRATTLRCCGWFRRRRRRPTTRTAWPSACSCCSVPAS